MPQLEQTRKAVRLGEWRGRISNADPHDIPPGAAQVQDNLQCLKAGALSARKGVQKSTTYSASGTDELISIYGYRRPEGDMVLAVDSAGALKWRRGGSATSLQTGLSTFQPWCFEKDRRGRAFWVNGVERGFIWNGQSSAPSDLGIDAPTGSPSVALNSTGGATAGDYVCGFRWVDSSLPPNTYSSLSDVATVTATASQRFTWTGTYTTAQSRVDLVQLWRSTASAPNVLYLVAEIGESGTITSSATGGGNVQFTLPTGHNLIVGAKFTVSSHSVGGYNTTHQVTAATATTVTTDQTYSSDGTGGTWVMAGYDADTSTDATLIANAITDPTSRLVILNPNGSLNARRFVPPPNWKAVVKSFQDRYFYAVDVVYTTGTVAVTSGSTTITGTGTGWTTEMAGRYIYVVGATRPYLISSVGSSTSITISEAAAESVSSGASYAIRSAPGDRNGVYYSEVDEPESVPRTNLIVLQENTDDDDDITGLMPFGAVLYVLKERHVYSLTFARQPRLDADVRLLAERGAFNQRCYDFHEGMAYLMDAAGIYRMSLGGDIEPLSGPIQDLFRDSIDYTAKKWFHVVIDPIFELAYFFVKLTGDSGTRPKRAIVYHLRSQAFWTETYPDEIGDSGKLPISSKIRPILAGMDDRVLLLNQGTTDMITAQIRGTATAGGNTTLTDSGANFGTLPTNTPVAIVSGTGKGQIRYVASNTSTEITVSSAWTTNPSTDSVYVVGAIEFSFKSGIFELAKYEKDHERAIEAVFNPTTNDNNLVIRAYENHDTSAQTQQVTHGQDVGGLLTRTAGSVDMDLDLKATDSSSNRRSGWGYVGLQGGYDHRNQGKRWVSFEFAGFKGDDAIDIYEATVYGAS